MKRKPTHPMSIEARENLSTRRLLARLKGLHPCEESASCSDPDDISNTSEAIRFKDAPEWKDAYERLKCLLPLREHVPNGDELAEKRHRQARLNRMVERRVWRRKPYRNTIVPLFLIVMFCHGRSFGQDEFLLAKQRAGAVVIGMTVDELHAIHKPSSTKLVANYPEGMFTPMLEIYLGAGANKTTPSLLIGIDKDRDWIVDSITVKDARFRTDKGVGIGSTLGAVRKAYAVSWIRFGEGPLCANVQDLNMTFELDVTNPPKEWYKTRDQRLIPDSANILSVRLYRSRATRKK
jgi:hypothetical protein